MCSTTDHTDGTSPGAGLGVLVEHFHELAATIAARVADPGTDLSALPVDVVAAQLRHLLSACDQGRATATVLTGVVDRAASAHQLIDGTYATAKRFLEVEAGLSLRAATALTARARDLRDAAENGDARLRYAWLAGVLSDDKVRELTLGIRTAVKHLPAGQRDVITRQALDLLLPLAPSQTVTELRRTVSRLRFVLDPDGIRQAELDAYTEQSLTCVPVGHLIRVQAFLEPEAAAALMTVLDQQVTGWLRDDALAPEERLPEGVSPDSAEGRRRQRARVAHLRAIALGETMTGLLGRAEAGMHHGVRPHTVLNVDVRDLTAGLGGELTMPGRDDAVLISSDAVRRILCDTGLTQVITRPSGATEAGATVGLPELLRQEAVDVLYVGREFRTAPPRLRRALEARDRHCQAPGCRRHPRRCNAHHVQHWQDGGDTTIANCLLLCERHHRAIHGGQLTITRDSTKYPTETGYFRVHPPDRPPRP